MPIYVTCPSCSGIDFYSHEGRTNKVEMRYQVEDADGDMWIAREEIREDDIYDRDVIDVYCKNCGAAVNDPEDANNCERHDNDPDGPGYLKIWATETEGWC